MLSYGIIWISYTEGGSKKMLLAIDVGNTNIMLGTIDNGEIVNIVRIHTESRYTAAEYGIQLRQLLDYYEIDPDCLDDAIICSVVPPVTERSLALPVITPLMAMLRISSASSGVTSISKGPSSQSD